VVLDYFLNLFGRRTTVALRYALDRDFQINGHPNKKVSLCIGHLSYLVEKASAENASC
jgi:hypothetical protein